MKIIETTFERLPRERLVIGFEGENLRATVRIDCSSVFAEYPNATPALIVKPLFADAYPVVVDRNGTDVDWLITSEILSFSGDGEIQLTFVKDQVICKSAIVKIRVCRSLTVTGEMPDVVATWIENANRKLAEVDAQIVELEGMVDTATDAATRAEQSASTASAKAEQAAGSAATATAKASEATNAAGTATAKAAEAQTAAQTATAKATAAAESERIATAKAVEATTAAGTATAKAEQATEAAQTATEKAADASASATAAQASATDAASSATAASASETAAKASETAASTSASQAAQSVLDASTAAQTATQKAAEATQSATDAATSATSAATSAETASTKAGEAAASAQVVAETAEQLADSLEQIEQNTQDITELDERKANIDGYYPDMTVGNAEQLNSSKYVENSEPYTLRTSGGTSDIGNREYLDAVVGGTVAWNQMVRDEASENSTDFAPIVTVTDAVEDAAGVKVKIEPVQDLHGYDHPWPAGGGKNLLGSKESKTFNIPSANSSFAFEKDSSQVTFTTSGLSSSIGYRFNNIDLKCTLPAGTYCFSSNISNQNTGSGLFVYNADTSAILARARLEEGGRFTLSDTTTIRLGASLSVSTTSGTYWFQLESGATPTSFEPYANICPIIGWDGVQVWDDPRYGGLVEWNQQLRNGNFEDTSNWSNSASSSTVSNNIVTITKNENTGAGVGYIRQLSFSYIVGHKYFATIDYKGIAGQQLTLFSNSASAGMENVIPVDSEWHTHAKIFDVSGTPSVPGIAWLNYATTVGNNVAYFRNYNIFDLTQMFGAGNEPTTVEEFRALFPNDFYAYNAGETMTVGQVNGEAYRAYTIEMPTEAGTVYGGELTVNADGSGSLVVNRAKKILNGTEPYGTSSYESNENYAHILLANTNYSKQNQGAIMCDKLISNGSAPYFNNGVGVWQGGSSVWYICVKKEWLESDNSAGMMAWIANSNLTCVYKLATPQTYTLTASEIRTLLGQNNIWADAGDISLTYTGTDEHLTLESGKKYLSRISGTDSMLLGSGQEITAAKGQDNVFDLTQMFGTAVADYVYGQGTSFFRKWFGKQWYPYNAGELLSVEGLQSHDMVGFNAFNKNDVKNGVFIDDGNGSEISATGAIASGWIPVIGGATYYIKSNATSGNWGAWYDADEAYISGTYKGLSTAPVNAAYLRFTVKNTASSLGSPDTLCISLAHNNSRNGEYEPYEKHSYPLDSTVVLRGIPKVDANGVYWDGDRYLPDGTVERRYGVVDMGTLNWLPDTNRVGVYYAYIATKKPSTTTKANSLMCSRYYDLHSSVSTSADKYVSDFASYAAGAVFARDTAYSDAASFKASVSGLLLLYELNTPTTETAQPYHSTQWVSDWGTEEFVSTGIVPVGTETRYPANLRDKLQHLPDAASGNGSYLITQTDGQMVLTPFPAPPSTAGNYVLKATVTNGVATYTWEVAT